VGCKGYKYKGTKIQENQGQSFVSGEQLKNIWYSQCLKVWRWRENSAKEKGAVRVKCTWCRQRDMVVEVSKENGKRNLCLECKTGKKQL